MGPPGHKYLKVSRDYCLVDLAHITYRVAEQIAFVEARIEELEKPQELRLTLPLHRPYTDERRSPSHQALSRGSSSAPRKNLYDIFAFRSNVIYQIQFFSLGRRVLWVCQHRPRRYGFSILPLSLEFKIHFKTLPPIDLEPL